MMVSGVVSRSFSISFLSRPARGGSTMTVWPGAISSVMFSDFSRIVL